MPRRSRATKTPAVTKTATRNSTKSATPAAATGHIADMALRALAISCVVGIHLLSGIHNSPYWNSSPFQTITITYDQFARLCVPLFVALSGWGLWQKYQKTEFKLWEFFQKRVFKLVPLYAVWTAIFMLSFSWIPAWRPGVPQPSFLYQLIWGRGDYHLYFVPMIFQLYLAFPIIMWLYRRQPWLVLFVAAIAQGAWYWFAGFQQQLPTFRYFQSDQQQYIWAVSWIWYFVLGMTLTRIHAAYQKRPTLVWLTGLATGLGFWWAASSALGAVHGGQDPLIATRFTRFPVLAYATALIPLLTWLAQGLKSAPKWVLQIGKHSYSIYLSHTWFLRLFFTWWYR